MNTTGRGLGDSRIDDWHTAFSVSVLGPGMPRKGSGEAMDIQAKAGQLTGECVYAACNSPNTTIGSSLFKDSLAKTLAAIDSCEYGQPVEYVLVTRSIAELKAISNGGPFGSGLDADVPRIEGVRVVECKYANFVLRMMPADAVGKGPYLMPLEEV